MNKGMAFPERVRIRTDDGIELCCRVYRHEGRRPVVLIHGLASSADIYDLNARGFRVAQRLYDEGYEPWLLNYRGAGHGADVSGAGDWHFWGDHIAAYDIKAIIEKVLADCELAPICIGHSFGGMALYMYLQGAAFDSKGNVKLDLGLAEERNSSIAGIITVSSGITFRQFSATVSERVRRNSLGQAYFRSMESWLRKRDNSKPRIRTGELSNRFGLEHAGFMRAFMSSPLVGFYMKPRNLTSETGRLIGTWGSGDMSALHLAQVAASARAGGLISISREGSIGGCDYSADLSAIRVPIAVVAGENDFVKPEHLKKDVLQRVASEKKRFKKVKGCSHIDVIFHTPYAEILNWMDGCK